MDEETFVLEESHFGQVAHTYLCWKANDRLQDADIDLAIKILPLVEGFLARCGCEFGLVQDEFRRMRRDLEDRREGGGKA